MWYGDGSGQYWMLELVVRTGNTYQFPPVPFQFFDYFTACHTVHNTHLYTRCKVVVLLLRDFDQAIIFSSRRHFAMAEYIYEQQNFGNENY